MVEQSAVNRSAVGSSPTVPASSRGSLHVAMMFLLISQELVGGSKRL